MVLDTLCRSGAVWRCSVVLPFRRECCIPRGQARGQQAPHAVGGTHVGLWGARGFWSCHAWVVVGVLLVAICQCFIFKVYLWVFLQLCSIHTSFWIFCLLCLCLPCPWSYECTFCCWLNMTLACGFLNLICLWVKFQVSNPGLVLGKDFRTWISSKWNLENIHLVSI